MTHRGQFALWAAVAALAASSLGCSSTSTCSRDEDFLDVYGWTNTDMTMFSSIDPSLAANDPKAALTWFPTNRTVRFHVGLAATPLAMNPYLSFNPDGTASTAPSAGSMSIIRTHTKDLITVHNDTCSQFWIWLTASTSKEPFTQVTDGGVDDGAGGGAGDTSADAAGAAGAE